MIQITVISYVFAAVVALAAARPQQDSLATTPPTILKYENDGVNYDGSYNWRYETSNQIVADERGTPGEITVEGEKQDVLRVEGSYSYTAPDGTRITVTYRADENGFVPQGDHLPTPPPIPEAIQRALEYIASHPSSENEARRRR